MVACCHSWRVFPLPDQPVQSIVPTTTAYTAPKISPTETQKPVLQTNVPPALEISPTGVDKAPAVSSTGKVDPPSKDLLPPKVRIIFQSNSSK